MSSLSRSAILSLLVLLAVPLPAAGAEHTRPIVESVVHDELAASPDGTAYVIVMLRQIAERPARDRAERRAEVAAIESRVLAGLDAGTFAPAYRFANFAGFTGRITAAGLARLEADPDVVAIGPDARGAAQLNVSVPFINADDVHSGLGITGQGVTVAVLDTGIDTDHPDLSDDIAPGAWHFLDQGGNTGPGAEDDNGHGTNVSGIVTGRGIVAATGVAPDARILAVKVLDAGASGWLSDWAAGVDYVTSLAAGDPGLRVINMSLGSFALYPECPCDFTTSFNLALQTAISAARGAGIVTFASSGNNGSTVSMSSPACVSSCVAVAAVYDQNLGPEPDSGTYESVYGSGFAACSDATTAGDKITCFSNRSGCNALAAPGRRITAAGLGGGLSTYTGTSQAAPHVAGTAALMFERAQDTSLDPATVVSILEATGVPTNDPAATSPNPIRIDALAAVLATPAGVPAMPPSWTLVAMGLAFGAGALALTRRRGIAWGDRAGGVEEEARRL